MNPRALEKAELRKLDPDFVTEVEKDRWVTVQFNPETLNVSFANQLATAQGSGDQKGGAARQFVGAGTMKLAAQLWFDVTSREDGAEPANDVRDLTRKVAYFITPHQEGEHFVPPAVRFLWGSFQFDGLMDSLEESLELFSPEGRPLRASVSFVLSQQKITELARGSAAGAPPGAAAKPAGTTPLTAAPAGATVQSLAAAAGRAGDWKEIAARNGIENPRQLAPGQLLDVTAGPRRSA
jgi:hypothetical protein